MAIQTDGTAYAMGSINSNAFTNGADDILLAGIKIDGSTYYTQHMGSTISEFPGDLVWNSATTQLNVFIKSNSVAFNN